MTINAQTKYEETSFWARDYGPYSPNPSLTESIHADVVLVGGGILGLSTAREFKKDNPNSRVVVLESEVIGAGPAGRNAGFTTTLFGLEPHVTKLRWGKQKTIDACHYAIRSVNYTKQLIEDHKLNNDYTHPGLLRIAYTKPQTKVLEGVNKIFEDLGVAGQMGLRWWSKDDLRNEFNSPIFSIGLSDIHSGQMNPCKHIRELKRLAVEVGVEIYEQTPAQKIERLDREVTINIPNAPVHADKVVLATNAYTHMLKGLKGTKGRQVPVWTAVIVTERLTKDQWASIGWANGWGFEDARQMIHYVRPTADGRILIGGQEFWTPWGYDKDMDHDFAPNIWRRLENHLKRMFPSLSEVKVSYRWSGPCSINFDMAPEIGYLGDERIIYWTGGFGHGVALAHLNGRLVADLLNGNKTELTDFWIVNRKAIPLPGTLLTYLGSYAVCKILKLVDSWQQRSMEKPHQ